MTFVDASKPAQYSEPVRVTGATGKTGQDGVQGETGNGIESITKYYLAGKTYYSWDDSVIDNMIVEQEMGSFRRGYS